MNKSGGARRDENGRYTGGQPGDQTTRELEISSVADFFAAYPSGVYMLRPKDTPVAECMADAMIVACNNDNIGYAQDTRDGVITYGVHSTVKINCDCSSLVRACCIASGFDPGDMYTGNEISKLTATGGFEPAVAVTASYAFKRGDVLVKPNGHTEIIVEDDQTATSTTTATASTSGCYPAYTGTSTSLVDALKSLGIDASFANRTTIANANGFPAYLGLASQNSALLKMLKAGTLKAPAGSTATTSTATAETFPAYTGSSVSIIDALKAVGAESSMAYRRKIAVKNGITTTEAAYKGTATQNRAMLKLLKAGTLIKP